MPGVMPHQDNLLSQSTKRLEHEPPRYILMMLTTLPKRGNCTVVSAQVPPKTCHGSEHPKPFQVPQLLSPFAPWQPDTPVRLLSYYKQKTARDS